MSKQKVLTKKQFEFVKFYTGDPKEAMIAAGYKWSKTAQYKLMNKKHVKEAIAAKQNAAAEAGGRKLGRAIDISRNDIIMGLADIARDTKVEPGTKVRAFSELAVIFGLRAKADGTDIFAGWTDEELESYRLTGELPARFRSAMGSGDGDSTTSDPSAT